MNKDIINKNINNQMHGYQERYDYYFFKLWYRANYIKSYPIGYLEWHSNMYQKSYFYIR